MNNIKFICTYIKLYIDRLLICDFNGTIYLHESFTNIIILLFYRFMLYFILSQVETDKIY